MNFNIIKRARPGQAKCGIDFPTVVDRHAVQLMCFTPNFVTSTHVLGPNTILDAVETEAMTKVAEGFKTCKFWLKEKGGSSKVKTTV